MNAAAKAEIPPAASPHSSTPNISAVHHADSRGSLVSTDSGNSLLDKSSDKTNSLEKVDERSKDLIAFISLNIVLLPQKPEHFRCEPVQYF